MKKVFRKVALSSILIMGVGASSLAKAVNPTCLEFSNNGYYIAADNLWNNSNVFMSAQYKYHNCWNWTGDLLKLFGRNYCLNAHLPSRGSNVDIFRCDSSDSEQYWNAINIELINGYTYYMIEKDGTNLCLNAHNISEGSNLNLYTCDNDDPEQKFKILGVLTTLPD